MTKNLTETAKTESKKITYQSITAGDKTYPFSPVIQKQFNRQYPGLLNLIHKTKFTGGREFTIYFRHTVEIENQKLKLSKKHDIITFVRGAGSGKNKNLKKPAPTIGTKFNPDNFGDSYPELSRYLSKFNNVIFIIGFFGKTDYRAIHYSYRF
jgi:hypothetical protein